MKKQNDDAKIKQHINKAVAKLEKAETTEVQGIKKADLLKLKEQVDASQVMSLMSMEMAGAYDNYYNHDTSTGWFRAQSLGFEAHKYIRIEGSTLGSTKNAGSMTTYKGHDLCSSIQNQVIQ